MKRTMLLMGILSLWIWSTAAHAAFVSGSTGALGAYNPTGNNVITLPSDGVLNYTTINIPSGVTVTFTKNANNTPVYMLASGDVIIAGTINVSGTNASANDIGKGGPGGFNGGYGGGIAILGGNGSGPGGGNAGPSLISPAGGGGFGTNGINGYKYSGNNPGAGGIGYGNSRLMPLIGGSGGAGGSGTSSASGYPGGGGGGAIVIASNTLITISGSILANGGNSSGKYYGPYGGGGGSGGGIKLISNIISGNGTITAAGGSGDSDNYGGNGGVGRIRIEATSNNRTASTNPAYTYGLPTIVFPANGPTLKITSIGGTNVPASPGGAYNQPDIILPSNTPNPVVVNVSATNIPLPNSVTITVNPQYLDATATNASPALSGTNNASTASASVKLSATYANVVTAQATFTILAFNYDGEEIDKVRVATRMGGKSETTYITKSGKEIKGELVAALVN